MTHEISKISFKSSLNFYFAFAIVALFAFLLPSFALAFSYDRTPAGASIESPVQIQVSFDDEEDTAWANFFTNDPAVLTWRVWIQNQLGSEDVYFSECKDYFTDLTVNESFDLAEGEYSVVSVRGYSTSDCSGSIVATSDVFPEYNEGETIFTVVASSPSGSGFDFSGVTLQANALKVELAQTGSLIVLGALASFLVLALMLMGAGYTWGKFKKFTGISKKL